MNYVSKDSRYENWMVEEEQFNSQFLGKCEAIFCQGNGYLGVRNSLEENYPLQKRNTFVSGTFNRFDEFEVTELPNVADVIAAEIKIDGEIFSLDKGKIEHYSRTLNLYTGETIRNITWVSPGNKKIEFIFKRFVSKDNRHLICQSVEAKALDTDFDIEIKSGINAQMTNTGSQHFHDGEKRVYDNKYLQLIQTTTQSKIDFVITAFATFQLDGKSIETKPRLLLERRCLYAIQSTKVSRTESVCFEKFSLIYTTRDNDIKQDITLPELQQFCLDSAKNIQQHDYNYYFDQNQKEWECYWQSQDIRIDSQNAFDQLAVRFAMYHLAVMTPAHDNRMGIGAKGISGEGYKGHSFWDTEIFMFPYWMFTNPAVARSLMEYRHNTIGGAYKKAADNGYQGAMYPWESAWADDGEVTPLWGAVDIVTGKSTKILSGLIEIHITADIAIALWQYYNTTKDRQFMEDHGYEIIFQTAKFWCSRFEWHPERQRYEISDVIGADEYKEHVNNNALTNYLAAHNMEIAVKCFEMLQADTPDILKRLEEQFQVSTIIEEINKMMPLLYLPKPRNEDGLIPQDDAYLTLQEIDLTRYKNQENVASMFHDYNLDQVNKIQVSKQADVVMLLYLLESKFDSETKWKNFQYYEAHTLHDSSLSLSTHTILGNDLGRSDLAYELFTKATQIDLGPNMKTSDEGIHAAAMGGIWQCCVNGFGGVRIFDDKLRIMPKLPAKWNALQYQIYWEGQPLEVTASQKDFTVRNKGNKAVTIKLSEEKGYQNIDAGEKITISL